jgi:hypothetical protein
MQSKMLIDALVEGTIKTKNEDDRGQKAGGKYVYE